MKELQVKANVCQEEGKKEESKYRGRTRSKRQYLKSINSGKMNRQSSFRKLMNFEITIEFHSSRMVTIDSSNQMGDCGGVQVEPRINESASKFGFVKLFKLIRSQADTARSSELDRKHYFSVMIRILSGESVLHLIKESCEISEFLKRDTS
jgi:hypothetical protein